MTVRLATLDDCDAIARVHIEASTRGEEGLMPASYLAWVADNADWLSGRWAKRLRDPGLNRVWVATEDDEVVGYAWACPADLPDEDALELHLIYVAPHKWGTGVAQQLMSAVVDHVRENAKPSAILWSLEANMRSRRFYEKCGWHFDGSKDIMTLHETEVPIVRYRLATRTS